MEENENDRSKKIEVVTGDGDLTISPVYEHLEVEKPRPKDNRTIIVPEVKDSFEPAKNSEENSSNDNEPVVDSNEDFTSNEEPTSYNSDNEEILVDEVINSNTEIDKEKNVSKNTLENSDEKSANESNNSNDDDNSQDDDIF